MLILLFLFCFIIKYQKSSSILFSFVNLILYSFFTIYFLSYSPVNFKLDTTVFHFYISIIPAIQIFFPWSNFYKIFLKHFLVFTIVFAVFNESVSLIDNPFLFYQRLIKYNQCSCISILSIFRNYYSC